MGLVGKATTYWTTSQRKRAIGKRATAIERARTLFPSDNVAMVRLPIIYGDNKCFITRTGAYTLSSVPQKPWGFLSNRQRADYYRQADSFFSQHFPTHHDASGHLIVTNRTYTADEWHANLMEANKERGGATLPVFARYVNRTKEQLNATAFYDRNVYIATRMGDRKEKGKLANIFADMVDDYLLGAAKDMDVPSSDEIARWHEAADSTATALANNWMHADPTNRATLEWLVRHKASPGLPTPSLWGGTDPAVWGLGKWRTLLASVTEVVTLGRGAEKELIRAVKVDGPTGTSYVCYLPLTYSPRDILHTQTWMHRASGLEFPVDIDLRFQVIDPERASKDLKKYSDKAESQQIEDREAGHKPDQAAMEQQAELEEANQQRRRSKKPLVYWQCVFSVANTDPNELKKQVSKLIAHYKTIDFKLECPPEDQRELFYQSLPGNDILVKDWEQKTDTTYLAAGAPWLASTIGDNKGMYQGFTLVQEGQTVQPGGPFFYDIQNVVDDDGKAPTEAVAGFPGSGKACSLDTLLPKAFGGYTTMGEVRIGDRILDESGQPCTVTGATPVMHDHTVYEVTFDDGTVVKADADHRWWVHDWAARSSARRAKRRDVTGKRVTKGSAEFAAAMRAVATTVDPEDVSGPRAMRLRYADQGGPNRDVWERVAKTLTPVGWYNPGKMLNGGTGRKYPLYSVQQYAEAMYAWATTPANHQVHKRALPKVLTTAQMADSVMVDGGSRANYSIPVAQPVRYPEADLPVDPYVLGAWLGDGNSSGSRAWASEDPEIINALADAGLETAEHHAVGNHIVYHVKGLRPLLGPLGVLNNKHIPDNYLRGSVAQRLALLQGLMDTDGTATKSGTCVFYQSDERLATQVRSLVASLGMKATIKSHDSYYTNPDGVDVPCKVAYQVAFTPTMDVFRLPRKLARTVGRDGTTATTGGRTRETTRHRYITDIRQVESVPVRCITVDSPSHLYLCTDQYVATHNTVSRGLKCVYEDAMRGVTQFVWDPKGDFLPLHREAKRFGLDPALVNLIDLDNPKASITLDAFAVGEVDFSDPDEPIDNRPNLARSTIARLISNIRTPNNAADLSSVVSSAVRLVHKTKPNPSMSQVLDVFEALSRKDPGILQDLKVAESSVGTWSGLARNIYDELVQVKETKLGKLLFKDGQSGTGALSAEAGSLTIFVALGLEIADPEQLALRDPTPNELLSDVIASMMVNHIRNLLSIKEIELEPKAATFDEWHAIRRAGGASSLYGWLKRMGRSRRTSVRQLSQSANDYDKGSLSTVWCGYVEDEDEAKASCELLGIEANLQNIQRLMNMQPGQFLFRDQRKQVAWVQIDIWDQWVLDTFNTQAASKKRMQEARKAAADAEMELTAAKST